MLWGFLLLTPDLQTVLEGYFYVEISLCSLHGLHREYIYSFFFFSFFGTRAVFSIDVCHLCPQCMLAVIPFMGGVTDVVVTRACPGY